MYAYIPVVMQLVFALGRSYIQRSSWYNLSSDAVVVEISSWWRHTAAYTEFLYFHMFLSVAVGEDINKQII